MQILREKVTNNNLKNKNNISNNDKKITKIAKVMSKKIFAVILIKKILIRLRKNPKKNDPVMWVGCEWNHL